METAANKAPRNVFAKWMVLVFSVLTYSPALGIPSSLSVMFLEWQDTFSSSRAHTAVVHSTCFSILLGGGVLAGYVMNRIGARSTILIGSVLAAAGLFSSAFATSIDYLIVSLGIGTGIGCCFVQLPVIPCATAIVKKYKTMVISVCLISTALIGIVNRYFIQYLIAQYSWRGTCMILAGMILQTSVSGMIITAVIKPPKRPPLLLVRDTEDNQDCNRSDNDFKQIAVSDNTRSSSEKNTSSILRNASSANSSPPERDNNEFSDGENGANHIMGDNSCVHSQLIVSKENNNGDDVDVQKTDPVTVVIENDGLFSNDDYGNNDKSVGSCINKTRCNPALRIIFSDMMFILLAMHVAICVSSLYSFCLILMDFARTLHFDESTGVLFLTVTFATSLVGRLIVGASDFFPKIHSFLIQAAISIPGCVSLLLLSFNTDRDIVICLLVAIGVSTGGLVSIYPKCALDVCSKTIQLYPIALGFFCMMEGVMSLSTSIFIGISVDATGSYTVILVIMGSASLLSSILLACGHFYTTRQQQKHGGSTGSLTVN